jgi:hypothetical protein
LKDQTPQGCKFRYACALWFFIKMTHLFNVEFAEKYGVNEAIILSNFIHWLKVNHANNRNIHEGKAWTYNTRKALTEIFPYWNDQQIYRIIQSLIKQGAVVAGNFSTDQRDRTVWYSVSGDIYETCIVRNQTIDCSEVNNPLFKNEQCSILYNNINTDNKQQIINTDNKLNPLNPPKGGYSPKPKTNFKKLVDDFLPAIPNPDWQDLIREFLYYKIEIKQPLKTPKSVQLFFKRLVKDSHDNIETARDYCEAAMANGWHSYHPDAGKSFYQQKADAKKAENAEREAKMLQDLEEKRQKEEEFRQQLAAQQAERQRKIEEFRRRQAEEEARQAEAKRKAEEAFRKFANGETDELPF